MAARMALDETSLRRRLKRETTAVHQHLEAQLGLLDPSLDVHRYRRVLETFYGFYVPVETDVTRLAAAEPPLGFPLRARAELIERDLLALGLSQAALAAIPLSRWLAETRRRSSSQSITSIRIRRPGAWASGRSQVTRVASIASARATYMASYALTLSRSFHTRPSRSTWG